MFVAASTAKKHGQSPNLDQELELLCNLGRLRKQPTSRQIEDSML